MKSKPFARFAPVMLAMTLLGSYAALIFGFPVFLSQFINFKIEMPMPTILAINLSRFLTSPIGIASCGILILALAFSLARGDKFAWGIGLLISLIFGEMQLCLLFPIIAASKSIGAFSIPHPVAQMFGILMITLVPPLCFLALRRAFCQQQPRRSQTLPA